MANLTRALLIKSRMVKGDLIKSTLVRFADSTRTSIEVREVPKSEIQDPRQNPRRLAPPTKKFMRFNAKR
jgi:hypothetical protein